MEVIKKAKDLTNDIEKGIEVVSQKATQTFKNLASHLPFSNLAKKDDSTFHIEIDLPGVKKDDIDLKIEDNMLIVTAIRKYQNELTQDDYYICESSFGKFERRYSIPENIDTKKIDAKYDNGRLEIELQKTKKSKPKSIAIK
jgi:HSP20 family protein